MREVFYEESAKVADEIKARRKYGILKTISVTFYVIAGLWAMLVYFAYDFSGDGILYTVLFVAVPFVYCIVSGIIFGRLKDKVYIDYDYTFVSGSIRFSKVINNIKRKNIVKFDCSSIERIGRYGSETFERYLLMPNKKVNVLTSNIKTVDTASLYYIVADVSGGKNVFVLECSERFISNILVFVNRTVIEEGFFK